MVAYILLSIISIAITLMAYILITKKLKKIEDEIHSFTIAGEDTFNDNEYNTAFIQKALDMLSEAGYEPDISIDENGHRWISAKINENTSVNTIKLSKELFKSKDFNPIKKQLENEIENVLPTFKNKETKKEC